VETELRHLLHPAKRHWIPLLTFLFALPISASFGQSPDSILSPVNKKRLKSIVIGTGLVYTASMTGLSQVWYSQYPHQSFQFFDDSPEWKQVDKAGHFYSAFHLSSIGSKTLQWSRLPKEKSDRIGALTSFVVMSSVEVFDGFSAGYGASATDILANACGSGFYLGQRLGWNEIRIYPKFSFHRTSLAPLSPNTLGTGLSEVLKDYNGQTYWLSVDMDKFIRFPKWLNISAGYGADNMIHARDSQNREAGYVPYRQYYLGLDLDLTAFKSKSKILNTLIYLANLIRLPAPALEFSQGKVKGHFLYF
jgi:uncharacterized protein YfiM (DUF2279 family)